MLKKKFYVYSEGKVDVPAHINFGKAVLDNMIANKHIDALINAATDKKLTYGELAQQTVDIALSLARMGVGKGDVVSICSEKRFEFMATVLGIICAGATFTPTPHPCGTKSLLHRLNIAKPKVMFCSLNAYQTHIEALRTLDCIKTYILYGDEAQDGAVLFKHFLTEHAPVEDFQPAPVDGLHDRVFLRFTSGTTGLPKGIPITHLSELATIRCGIIDGVPGHTVLNTREWWYTYGLTYTLACLSQANTVIYCPDNRLVDFFEAIQKYKIERIQLAPPTINEFIKSPIIQDYDVTSVKIIACASTTLLQEAIVAVKKKFSGLEEVIQMYGTTEAGLICTNSFVPNGTKAGSVGVACPDIIIKVVDLESREPLGPYQRGEICFKSTSPTSVSKYLAGHPNPNDEEGFYKTGDVGYYDDDHCFYILDRIKDLVKCNGYTVAPAELESLLEQHPSVLEAGVVGTPHEQYVEAPLAFVVLRPGTSLTEADLVDYVNRQVHHIMKLHGGVRFLDSLPRGAGDKLDRKALKKMVLK